MVKMFHMQNHHMLLSLCLLYATGFACMKIQRMIYHKDKIITGEKKMLSNAKQILVSELVLAENSSIEEVEGMIDNKINSSFQEFEIDNIEPVQNVVNKFIPFDEGTAGTVENL